eukprot:GCRY01000926.1.p1 GENE.GCRY01000926.1~~GCRY01000926.1.p1  ORF type:complete len:867 (+),score=252.04 GCRY01000926.1:141-2741(+)
MAEIENFDFEKAKLYLQQQYVDPDTGKETSVYDHLTSSILELISHQPKNAVEIFDEVSRNVKSEKFAVPVEEKLAVVEENEAALELTKKLFDLMKAKEPSYDEEGEPIEEEELNEGEVENVNMNAFHFSQCGFAIGNQSVVTALFLALQKLSQSQPLAKVRFFGKFFGIEKDYYIAEAEFKQGERGSMDEEEEEGESENEEEGEASPPTDKQAPKEEETGVNTYVYFVCNYIGDEWVRLPDVSPQQIVAARKIVKTFSGDLNRPVSSIPPFPWTESVYLRAQIARINHATALAPKGLFIFEEDEEEETGTGNVIEDPEYEGTSLTDLETIDGWVHKESYILPQGRITWWNPKGDLILNENDDESLDGSEHEEELEPEEGPQQLSSVGEDEDVGPYPAWSVGSSSSLYPPAHRTYFVRSQRWPGAVAYYYNRTYANIYIGDGLKFTGKPFSPEAPPAPKAEYIIPEPEEEEEPIVLTEMMDPTVEQERAAEPEEEEDEDHESDEDAQEEEEEEEEESFPDEDGATMSYSKKGFVRMIRKHRSLGRWHDYSASIDSDDRVLRLMDSEKDDGNRIEVLLDGCGVAANTEVPGRDNCFEITHANMVTVKANGREELEDQTLLFVCESHERMEEWVAVLLGPPAVEVSATDVPDRLRHKTMVLLSNAQAVVIRVLCAYVQRDFSGILALATSPLEKTKSFFKKSSDASTEPLPDSENALVLVSGKAGDLKMKMAPMLDRLAMTLQLQMGALYPAGFQRVLRRIWSTLTTDFETIVLHPEKSSSKTGLTDANLSQLRTALDQLRDFFECGGEGLEDRCASLSLRTAEKWNATVPVSLHLGLKTRLVSAISLWIMLSYFSVSFIYLFLFFLLL